jgi:UDP-N-acetylglucosamine 2-epimerase (non-hydrolysing)
MPAKHPIRVACVAGARPNFIKVSALVEELSRRPQFESRLIHTGQHFSPEMSAIFFDELELPAPDCHLGVGSSSAATPAEQLTETMRRLEAEFKASKPDVTIVVGDVTSTLAAALVCSKLDIRVAHVEAGLRSFDRSMPEEVNRVITDSISDDLFVSEPSGMANLKAEGVPDEKVHFVGNVMIDTLLRFRSKAAESQVLERLALQPGTYGVATLHRPSNVDSTEQLAALVGVLSVIAERLPIVFAVHPRTRQRIDAAQLETGNLKLLPPQGYLDFLHLLSAARIVLTDSGGIQEETTILGVPCLTLRENTERPATVEFGTNQVVGTDPTAIHAAAVNVLDSNATSKTAPDLWDGSAASRILDLLEKAVRG